MGEKRLTTFGDAPKPFEMRGWVILNPDGDVWSPTVHPTEGAAREYLVNYLRSLYRGDGGKPEEFKIVPGKSITSVEPSHA